MESLPGGSISAVMAFLNLRLHGHGRMPSCAIIDILKPLGHWEILWHAVQTCRALVSHVLQQEA